jgi:hypothetical protein
MKAWIIKWSWIGDHAAVDRPNIAVLSARTSAETVRRYVEFLYTSQQSLRDQLDQARYNKPKPNPYPAQFVGNWQGAITCGHNPFLEAFLAEDVCLVMGDDGSEHLSFNRPRVPSVVRGSE